ncbi:MAG: DUF4932 domain-containing protein, partial [Bacteroidales bacterium]|nr:DUF4932 domain-containing protein [Bacteroidales bacterium]
MMQRLYAEKGIGYNAPMDYALHLIKDGDGFKMVNDSIVPEERWEELDRNAIADTISDFYWVSDFARFFKEHQDFYERKCQIFDQHILSRFNQKWYTDFYGNPPLETYAILLGFINGGCNYGCNRQLPGQPREIFAVLGYAFGDSLTAYETQPDVYLGILVHEFNHSFVNPLIEDGQMFTETMGDAGAKLQQFCEAIMNWQAYPEWQNIINESIVRAAVICYLQDQNTADSTIRQAILDEMQVRFVWMPELVLKMQEYRHNRNLYPTFDAFYPELVAFFNDYADSRNQAIRRITHPTDTEKPGKSAKRRR